MAIDTRLSYFQDCTRDFILNALDRSTTSLRTCALVQRPDIIPQDVLQHVLPIRGLRVLDLSFCVEVNASVFRGVAQSLTRLEVLYLKNLPFLDDEGMTALASSCKLLKLLDVSCCPKLTGAAVAAIGLHLKELKMFNVDEMYSLHTEDLAPLLLNAGSVGLHTLNLRQCHNLRGLATAATAGLGSDSTVSLLRMENLNLSGVHHLTDDSLGPLESAKNLKALNLSFCHRLSDEALFLMSKLNALEHLDMTYIYNITDAGLQAIHGLVRLRSLAFNHCRKITTGGVSGLVRCLVTLRQLRLRHCAQIQSTPLLQSMNLIPQTPSSMGASSSSVSSSSSSSSSSYSASSSSYSASSSLGLSSFSSSSSSSSSAASELDLIDIRGCSMPRGLTAAPSFSPAPTSGVSASPSGSVSPLVIPGFHQHIPLLLIRVREAKDA